jgi:recombination protein U
MAGRGNRGKILERNILQANAYYEQRGQALITQMPTPVNITKVVANKVSGYLTRSTVDFYGTMKGGRSVYFDAKETNEPRFPVANETKLHPHQIEYLGKQHVLGALCFLVVEYTAEQEVYVIPWPVVAKYLKEAAEGGRKSIPIKDCQERDDIFRIQTAPGFLDYMQPALDGEFGIW